MREEKENVSEKLETFASQMVIEEHRMPTMVHSCANDATFSALSLPSPLGRPTCFAFPSIGLLLLFFEFSNN